MKIESPKVVLVTGGACRIGAAISRKFHQEGWNIVIHYRHSKAEAENLSNALNQLRPGSVKCICGNLSLENFSNDMCKRIAEQGIEAFGRVDTLINNASAFPSDEDIELKQSWVDLFQMNAISPYWLTGFLKTEISKRNGSVVNLLDVRATNLNPVVGHALYTASKAAFHSLTISSAKEHSPDIRVNAVSPGMILPPTGSGWEEADAQAAATRIPLQKVGTPQDVANAVLWLSSANHVTGQIITVDGGESYKW